MALWKKNKKKDTGDNKQDDATLNDGGSIDALIEAMVAEAAESNDAHKAEPEGLFAELFGALEEDEPEALEEEAELDPERERSLKVLGMVMFIATLLALLSLAYFLLLIKNIEVVGNEKLDDQDIIALSGIKEGSHIWLANLDDAKNAFKNNPSVAIAQIERVYPDTIRITIEERHRAAAIIGVSTVAVIDAEGYVMSMAAAEDTTGLIRVYGAGSSGLQVNRFIAEKSDFTARALVSMISSLDSHALSDRIDAIDISNALSISMTTLVGYTVHIGQIEDVDEKLEKLAIALPELERLGLSGGTIDVSVKGDPVYTMLRPSAQYDNAPASDETPAPDAAAQPDETPAPDAAAQPDETPAQPPEQTPQETKAPQEP